MWPSLSRPGYRAKLRRSVLYGNDPHSLLIFIGLTLVLGDQLIGEQQITCESGTHDSSHQVATDGRHNSVSPVQFELLLGDGV